MKDHFFRLFSNRKVVYMLAIFLAAFLFFGGFFWGEYAARKDIALSDSVEIRQAGYEFINPLLECEIGGNAPILESSEVKMKDEIQKKVIEKNPAVEISLYYRDLKNGPWFGIDEKSGYSPASLLKVPLMIAYYKHAEKNPMIFQKKVLFEKSSSEFHQQVQPQEHIQVGQNYTIGQLIESMIKYSDNEATNLLFQNISPDDLSVVFKDLGISMPDIYDADNVMSVKDYASFFRILYNASYLDRDMSEQALKLLYTVDYKDGLVAGIPDGVSISHKFGERESLGPDNQIVRQLHDCGIVYHKSHPYLICVMTKGKNFGNLSRIVAEVSKIVYSQVDKSSR